MWHNILCVTYYKPQKKGIMRKLIIALLVFPMFVSCNQKELKQLREQNKQLTQMTKEKDSTINEFIESLNTIEENLAIITEKEKIIAVDTKETPTKDKRAKIANDITLISDLLQQNRSDIENLNKKLKNSWYKNSKLTKLTARLQKELEEKEVEISTLKDKVAKLNIEVDNLSGQVNELNSTVAALNTENENKTQIIGEKTLALNTAYYVAGTNQELKQKQVILREGGFLGIGRSSKLNKDLNEKDFTKIDITKTTTIPVSGKSIRLVTSHPEGSYQIEMTDNKAEGIKILKPEEFWKASKFLVVQVR